MPGRCLRQSWGGGGCPMQHTPHIGFPFDYWCYLGSCMGAFRWPGPSSPVSSNLLRSAAGSEEKGNFLLAHIFLLVFITCTCLGEMA